MAQDAMTRTRTETDSLGSLEIPADAYWGIHTARALVNFPITRRAISNYPDLIFALARVKQAVSIPVVANGDIHSFSDARRVLEQSGADAVMIGRAHCGAPWVAGAVAAEAAGTEGAGVPRTPDQLADYVDAHYEDMLGLYGVEPGLRHARKHLGWYLDRHAAGSDPEHRRAILTGTEPAIVRRLLREAFARGRGEAVPRKAA